MTHKEQLIHIGQSIVNAIGVDEEIRAANLFAEFLNQFPLQPHNESFNTETRLEGGVALKPADAALCLREYIRTARFIKGTYMAIKELISRFPGEKIHILYAGCGPYATILLPILPLFSESETDAVLLDIHEYSTTSVKQLFSATDINGYVRSIVTANAITYTYPDDIPLHLVISETMYHALTHEPQVAITANLAPQLTKNGILIPEEISVYPVYTFHAYEPFLFISQQQQRAVPPSPSWESKHEIGKKLFSVSLQHNFSDLYGRSSPFESDWFAVPSDLTTNPDIDIFTHIKIFDTIELGTAESSITNPFCLGSLSFFRQHSHYKLVYHFNDVPAWSYELKA